jgi:hypothetical protein
VPEVQIFSDSERMTGDTMGMRDPSRICGGRSWLLIVDAFSSPLSRLVA